MDNLIISWIYRAIAFITLIACSVILFYVTKLVNNMSGCFRRAFSFVSFGVVFTMLQIILLNLIYWNILMEGEILILIRNILIALSIIFVAIGAFGLQYALSFIPKTIIDKVNESCMKKY